MNNTCKSLQLTAKSWIILDDDTKSILMSSHENDRREIASLTKIMTAYTSLKIMEALAINAEETKVKVSNEAASMGGTTAELAEGDILTLYDMLYAMLLPSGNDAAYALAEYFGHILLDIRIRGQYKAINPVQVFVYEMNKNAKSLGMTKTNFANPHGLQNVLNKSSALDIAILCSAAMKFPLFAKIVSTVYYECSGIDYEKKNIDFCWNNTDKLLIDGFRGIKTGITGSAGPCLASNYCDDDVNLIMVVLCCKTADHRWEEVIKMRNWILERIDELLPINDQIHHKEKNISAPKSKSKNKIY